MSSPRLLVYTPSYIGEKSPELWARIYKEYQALSKKFDIVVITEETTSHVEENISIVKIPKISSGFLKILYRMVVMPLITLKQWNKFDVIFLRVLDYSYMFSGIITKKFLKIKLIIYLSNTDVGLVGLQNRMYKWLYKKTLQEADIIITSSPLILKNVENYVGTIDTSKTVVVKNSIDSSQFRSLNIEKNFCDLLFVGRIHTIKGIEDIIKALKIVMRDLPNTKLKIIGKIDQKNYYKYLKNVILKLNCEKNIEFLGPVNHDQLIYHYNSSKIFVLTSRSETESQATLEAMACELPVIVTSVGILEELIIDGENGFLVKPNQLNLIAEKIILLLNNSSLCTQIGKAAREKLLNKGNFDSYIDELSKIIHTTYPK